MDYSFRAGLFMGDYDQVSYPNFPQLQNDHDGDAVAIWTDARNGRGSGAPTSFQAGRNPACEQADMFLDFFNPMREDHSDAVSESEENAFLATPCPGGTTTRQASHRATRRAASGRPYVCSADFPYLYIRADICT